MFATLYNKSETMNDIKNKIMYKKKKNQLEHFSRYF